MKLFIYFSLIFFFSCLSNESSEATITTKHGVWLEKYASQFDSVRVNVFIENKLDSSYLFLKSELPSDQKYRYQIIADENKAIRTEALIFQTDTLIAKQFDEFTSGQIPNIPQPFFRPSLKLFVTQKGETHPFYSAWNSIEFAIEISDPDNDMQKIIWDFGDGNIDTTEISTLKQEHLFYQAKDFQVKIIVADAKGLSGVLNEKLSISTGELKFTKSPPLKTMGIGDIFSFRYSILSDAGGFIYGLDMDLDGEIDQTDTNQTHPDFQILNTNGSKFNGTFNYSVSEYEISFNKAGEYKIPILAINQFLKTYDTLKINVIEPYSIAVANKQFKVLPEGQSYSSIGVKYQYADTLKVNATDTLFFFGSFKEKDNLSIFKQAPKFFFWDFDNDGIWDKTIDANLFPIDNPDRDRKYLGEHVYGPAFKGTVQTVLFGLENKYGYLSKDTVFIQLK